MSDASTPDTPKPRSLSPRFAKPHVVILGAGASYAGFPNGDRNGRLLPVMTNLTSLVGLEDLFRQAGVEYAGNFEESYGRLKDLDDQQQVALEMERQVQVYFSEMRLPDEPTLYDLLLLSLRPKDLVATFNWDPLLVEACVRTSKLAPPPRLVFLHGNTAVGVCEDCRLVRPIRTTCSRCGEDLQPTRLLYPVARKNYNTDAFIAAEWRTIRRALGEAYMLTLFGYGAPTSDVEAVSLLREGWGPREQRNLEEVEIIDIKPEDELTETWDGFIHSHHYRVERSFYDSWMFRFPRRSCEAMWSQLMELNWDPAGTPFPQGSWTELREATAELFLAEEA